jgi:hypothetical protein
MGLRLVRLVCDDVVIGRGAGGATVIVRMGLPGPDAVRPES